MFLPGPEITKCSVQEQDEPTITNIEVFEYLAVQGGSTEFIHGGSLWFSL